MFPFAGRDQTGGTRSAWLVRELVLCKRISFSEVTRGQLFCYASRRLPPSSRIFLAQNPLLHRTSYAKELPLRRLRHHGYKCFSRGCRTAAFPSRETSWGEGETTWKSEFCLESII